jgi:hypothetical protein
MTPTLASKLTDLALGYGRHVARTTAIFKSQTIVVTTIVNLAASAGFADVIEQPKKPYQELLNRSSKYCSPKYIYNNFPACLFSISLSFCHTLYSIRNR